MVSLMLAILKVTLMMRVIFFKIVRRREQLQMMMVGHCLVAVVGLTGVGPDAARKVVDVNE